MARDFFQVQARGSSARTEILGGLTTFTTMAYIIVVNPAILSFAGFPAGPSTVATILAAAFGCLAMGLYANRPFAVAPYMGENAFLAFGLAALGITWEQRLGAVFWGGVLFAVLTLLRVRSWLAAAISPSLKHSFAVGIGLFLPHRPLRERHRHQLRNRPAAGRAGRLPRGHVAAAGSTPEAGRPGRAACPPGHRRVRADGRPSPARHPRGHPHRDGGHRGRGHRPRPGHRSAGV